MITKYWIEFSVLYSGSLLASHCIYLGVHMRPCFFHTSFPRLIFISRQSLDWRKQHRGEQGEARTGNGDCLLDRGTVSSASPRSRTQVHYNPPCHFPAGIRGALSGESGPTHRKSLTSWYLGGPRDKVTWPSGPAVDGLSPPELPNRFFSPSL